jgi:hypothetical protein
MLGTGAGIVAGIVAGEVGGTEAGTVAGTVAVVHGERTGAHRIVGIAPGPAAIARLAAWCEARGLLLLEVRTEGGTLEERYLELTGETGADGAAR